MVEGETNKKKDRNLLDKVKLFIKGVLMGLADVVPGVSGGTIALITGIYEELIFSINSANPTKIIKNLIKRNKNQLIQSIKQINYIFLIILGLGVITSFLVASRFILLLLDKFPVYTYSFFFGLIAASAVKIYQRIEEGAFYKTLVTLTIGAITGFVVTGITSSHITHTPPIIFLSGALAILAMILPGISGSFILLAIGQYKYMLSVLHNINTKYIDLILFLTGATISLFTFTNILSNILKKYRKPTLASLTGLMLGALRLPATKILTAPQTTPTYNWTPQTTTITIIALTIGIITVTIIEQN
ncbi:MAG: putative membrane protein, DUF368 family [Candidatus Methanohalarchaeum thermophilum]|uniref:Membrane protein, DUF368 family n=1 Tax=Methanohalarchaeum thermophilum TaxID=1903181 RepID=A0A1Q6DSY0_METT1|nr:MAG: putative membrane protein, DUF368 family [Candidatus Methanohalarchaeum thermophilum]